MIRPPSTKNEGDECDVAHPAIKEESYLSRAVRRKGQASRNNGRFPLVIVVRRRLTIHGVGYASHLVSRLSPFMIS